MWTTVTGEPSHGSGVLPRVTTSRSQPPTSEQSTASSPVLTGSLQCQCSVPTHALFPSWYSHTVAVLQTQTTEPHHASVSPPMQWGNEYLQVSQRLSRLTQVTGLKVLAAMKPWLRTLEHTGDPHVCL